MNGESTGPGAVPPDAGVHPDGGPDLEALAAYDLDREFPPAGAGHETTAAHVAACPDCTARLGVLRELVGEVRALLPPMPADLGARLSATATTATAATAQPAGATAAAAEPATVTPIGTAGGRHRDRGALGAPVLRRGRMLRTVTGLAAGLILLGGGGYLVAGIGDGGSDAASSAASGGGASDEGGEGAVSSVAEFDRQSLLAAVPSLLTEPESAPQPQSSAGGGAPGTAAEPPTDSGTTVPTCLARVPVATAQALAIVPARYDGVPALILLFADGPAAVQVTVVTDCADGSVPRVLDEFTAPR